MADAAPDDANHDTCAKEILTLGLEPFGTVESQHEVPSAVQWADLWFEPRDEPMRGEAIPDVLKLLGQMGRTPALFEVFRGNPDRDEALDVIDKALTLHRRRRPRRGRGQGGDGGPYRRAHLWILSPGRPSTLLAALGARADTEGWRRGFFKLPEAFNTHLVAIRLLPESRETLLLRLLGAGRTQRRAFEELSGLPEGELKDSVAQALLRWRVAALEQLDTTQDPRAREIVVNTQEWYEKYMKEQTRTAREEAVRETREWYEQFMEEQTRAAREQAVREVVATYERRMQEQTEAARAEAAREVGAEYERRMQEQTEAARAEAAREVGAEYERRIQEQTEAARAEAAREVGAEYERRIQEQTEAARAEAAREVGAEYERRIQEQTEAAREDATLRTLVHLFERRLGRELSEAERAALERRIDAGELEAVEAAVIELDVGALTVWLSEA